MQELVDMYTSRQVGGSLTATVDGMYKFVTATPADYAWNRSTCHPNTGSGGNRIGAILCVSGSKHRACLDAVGTLGEFVPRCTTQANAHSTYTQGNVKQDQQMILINFVSFAHPLSLHQKSIMLT